MSLQDRNRYGQSQVSRGLLVTEQEWSPNRQIVKSPSGHWYTKRKTTGHYYSRLFLEALRQSRFSRPVQAIQERGPYSYGRTTRTRTYMHLRIRASLHRSTNRCTSTRVRVYTLKGGYIGFPVTTNLPRHRAIYISVKSIAPTKNQ